jgi:hypothetical protein
MTWLEDSDAMMHICDCLLQRMGVVPIQWGPLSGGAQSSHDLSSSVDRRLLPRGGV